MQPSYWLARGGNAMLRETQLPKEKWRVLGFSSSPDIAGPAGTGTGKAGNRLTSVFVTVDGQPRDLMVLAMSRGIADALTLYCYDSGKGTALPRHTITFKHALLPGFNVQGKFTEIEIDGDEVVMTGMALPQPPRFQMMKQR